MSIEDNIPRKFHYFIKEIRFFTSSSEVIFKHVNRSTNTIADSLAKQGVDREAPFIGI